MKDKIIEILEKFSKELVNTHYNADVVFEDDFEDVAEEINKEVDKKVAFEIANALCKQAALNVKSYVNGGLYSNKEDK